MPVFGARMVCDSGNYKLMKERQKIQLRREMSLGSWVSERSERKVALRELQELTKKAENILTLKTRSMSSSLPDDERHSRSRSGSGDLDNGNIVPRGKKRSKSLVPCLILSYGSCEVLYSPNEPKSRSRVDLLRHEECNDYDRQSNTNLSSPKRHRKPRSSSLGTEV